MLRWNAPGPYEVVFSTRVGGVSEGPYESLNLGRMTGDDVERVDENRRRLCDAVDADPDRLALNRQQHSATVRRARAGARGCATGDGLWTEEGELPMLALAADCVLVAVARANGGNPGLAVLHAGWRGLLEGVVERAVATLGGSTSAVVGPAIGPCCYEVGEEVAERFRRAFGSDVVRDRKLDLWTASERALRLAGCAAVERLDLCTACNPDLFFSERRTGKPRGTHGVIGLVRG